MGNQRWDTRGVAEVCLRNDKSALRSDKFSILVLLAARRVFNSKSIPNDRRSCMNLNENEKFKAESPHHHQSRGSCEYSNRPLKI